MTIDAAPGTSRRRQRQQRRRRRPLRPLGRGRSFLVSCGLSLLIATNTATPSVSAWTTKIKASLKSVPSESLSMSGSPLEPFVYLSRWPRPTTSITNRARFLASSATSFVAATNLVIIVSTTAALGYPPQIAGAMVPTTVTKTSSTSQFSNPRYIEKELEMTMNGPGNNPRTRGVLVRRFTGDSTPYQFPVTPIRLVKEWPTTRPFSSSDFSRIDPTNDGIFYSFPKLVYHIDEPAVAALTQYYRTSIPPGSDILDICSSWVSHYPLEFPNIMGKICAIGMNGLELQWNDQLTAGYKVCDLNENPKIPYPDESFDIVTCVVSIDYLIYPMDVLQEIHRVLRSGGKVIISQSNRCFPSKAISMWLTMNDRQHLELINGFFQYAGGFHPRQAYDITATVPNNEYHDPMFVIEAVKK